MSRRTRWIVMAVAAASVAAAVTVGAAAGAERPQQSEEAGKPGLLVLGFHADWCGLCERMAEPEAEARRRVADKPVLFVNLDLTDDQTRKQSRMLAAMLGLSEVYADHGERTGFALLIDPRTRETLGRLTAQHSADEMTQRIADALQRASAS